MKHIELQKLTSARFSRLADTENSIVIGTFGSLNEENTTQEVISYFVGYFGLSVKLDAYNYQRITPEEAIKRGCKLPTGNYNQFIEIFKQAAG